jgi:hypothetical protein
MFCLHQTLIYFNLIYLCSALLKISVKMSKALESNLFMYNIVVV